MQSNTSRRWLPPATGLTLLACALATHAATGARVVVQAWNPLQPERTNNVTLAEHPTLVSDSLQDAWAQARPKICEQLRLKMGLGGAAHGETLRDITCLLDEQVVLDVVPAGQNALRATFAVSGYVEATSTTPDIYFGIGLGDYADPRFSLALTAKLDLTLSVQPNPNQTLRVSKARFTLDKATLDSHNFSGDMLEFVAGELVPFFGGPDYKRMAENAVNAVSEDFTVDFNTALEPVNALLTGPSDHIRVGVSGKDRYISVAFAARDIAPPTNGSVTGLVRWDPASFTPRNGCQSFDIRARVQTGPVPLYAWNSNPPTREMGLFQAEPHGVGTCKFTLSGIAAGWPNVLISRVLDPPIVKDSRSSPYRETYTLAKDGWNAPMVIPQPALDARNYRVSAYTLKMADMAKMEAPDRAYLEGGYRTDPRFDPADMHARQAADPDTANVISPRMSNGISRRVEAVSLNPQPLPPEPDPAPQAQAVQAEAIARPAGSPAAIIIVGGKPAYRRVDESTSTTSTSTTIDRKVAEPPR